MIFDISQSKGTAMSSSTVDTSELDPEVICTVKNGQMIKFTQDGNVGKVLWAGTYDKNRLVIILPNQEEADEVAFTCIVYTVFKQMLAYDYGAMRDTPLEACINNALTDVSHRVLEDSIKTAVAERKVQVTYGIATH